MLSVKSFLPQSRLFRAAEQFCRAWSECEVSSQTLLSCLREAAEERVKEKSRRRRRKEEGGSRGKISQRLSAGGGPQGRWEVRGGGARGERGGNGWVREPPALAQPPPSTYPLHRHPHASSKHTLYSRSTFLEATLIRRSHWKVKQVL